MADPKDMHRCPTVNCGYCYDPERGDKRKKVPKGTKFDELPEGWKCPVCGCSKERFECLVPEPPK